MAIRTGAHPSAPAPAPTPRRRQGRGQGPTFLLLACALWLSGSWLLSSSSAWLGTLQALDSAWQLVRRGECPIPATMRRPPSAPTLSMPPAL